MSKIKLPHGIKTPTTVEEFRENLKTYYVTVGKDNNELIVQGHKDVFIDDLNSLDDIYKITQSGFYGNGTSPNITPLCELKKDMTEYMRETGQIFSFNQYFLNESNYVIHKDVFRDDWTPKWTSLDNQIYREFYMITLGEYSGYGRITDEELNEYYNSK